MQKPYRSAFFIAVGVFQSNSPVVSLNGTSTVIIPPSPSLVHFNTSSQMFLIRGCWKSLPLPSTIFWVLVMNCNEPCPKVVIRPSLHSSKKWNLNCRPGRMERGTSRCNSCISSAIVTARGTGAAWPLCVVGMLADE